VLTFYLSLICDLDRFCNLEDFKLNRSFLNGDDQKGFKCLSEKVNPQKSASPVCVFGYSGDSPSAPVTVIMEGARSPETAWLFF
jgi:hypothetical protein